MNMNFISKLHNKKRTESSKNIEVLSVENQDTPICLSAYSNQALFCGLLNETDSPGEKK